MAKYVVCGVRVCTSDCESERDGFDSRLTTLGILAATGWELVVAQCKENVMASVVDRPTLILNRNWQAINVAPVSRALVMVWNGTA